MAPVNATRMEKENMTQNDEIEFASPLNMIIFFFA